MGIGKHWSKEDTYSNSFNSDQNDHLRKIFEIQEYLVL